MEVIECKNNIRCELGACKNRAVHAIKFDRVGIRSRIYACDKCLNELYSAIGAAIIPKSVETARRKPKKDAGK
ncbi:MAG: hypothetical protein NC184_04285 [Roseburia sp.]|nr:hypothetical protein [Roseburia sp.]